jgi:hypothetical protein
VDGVEEPESSPEELSSAGVSGGLPPQASQVSGAVARRRRVIERVRA